MIATLYTISNFFYFETVEEFFGRLNPVAGVIFTGEHCWSS